MNSPRSYLKSGSINSFRCIRCHLHKIIRHRGNSIGDILKYLKIGIVHIHIFIELCNPKNEQMKILYIILFIQIGWIFPLSAQKQDSIYIGTRHTLFSEILNEERKYWIYVPETKAGEKGKAYPVLYLLMEIPSFIPWLVLRVSSLLLKPQTYLLASLWLF